MQVITVKRWIRCCAGAALLCGICASAEDGMRFVEDKENSRFTITEGGKPVLTYNFGNVPVPPGVTGKYAVVRSDYIHPLYGPNGEVLTKDYAPDHAHHRGIYWAWPEVTWKGETRDLHALQGVFSRPVKIFRQDITSDSAVLEAENVWKWGDTDPIVKERAIISAWKTEAGRREIDFEFHLQALVDGVTIARRGKVNYGGFNIRLSARAGQTIVKYEDPAGLSNRQVWACLTGVPPGGQQPVSVVILQDKMNPEYPGDWVDFPQLNWLQPTFPSRGTSYALKKDVTLVLRYRLVVGYGELDKPVLQQLWTEYNRNKE